jgi:hypothetical protein
MEREREEKDEKRTRERGGGGNKEWTTGSQRVEASDNKDGTKSTHLFFR